LLFEGVRDVVTLSVSPSSVTTGQPMTFTGSATPNKAGDVVYLQRLGADRGWHTVSAHFVRPDSSFEFVVRSGTAGENTFRVRVLPDRGNVGGTSPPVTVTVSQPPVSSLPPAR
jgi:hypothetical protein